MPHLVRHARHLAVAACLALTASAPRTPPSQIAAESVSLSLDGPCGGFSYRDNGGARGETFGAWPVTAFPTPRYMLREATALACQGQGWDGAAGLLFGQHLAADNASPYLAGGYRVDLGGWALTADAGLIFNRYNHRPHRAAGAIQLGGGNLFILVAVKTEF